MELKPVRLKLWFSLLLLPLTAFAGVVINIISNLPTKVMTNYNLSVFIENNYMIVPGYPRSFGMFNEETVTTHLYSSPIGGSETYIDIYHDSQHPSTTFCILDVILNPFSSTIDSIAWIKSEPWQPPPTNRTKPAKCSYAISGQVVNVYINYSGQPS